MAFDRGDAIGRGWELADQAGSAKLAVQSKVRIVCGRNFGFLDWVVLAIDGIGMARVGAGQFFCRRAFPLDQAGDGSTEMGSCRSEGEERNRIARALEAGAR